MCTFNINALETSLKGHLHMQEINRFKKDNQSIECYTYFCNQRSIFLVLFAFSKQAQRSSEHAM